MWPSASAAVPVMIASPWGRLARPWPERLAVDLTSRKGRTLVRDARESGPGRTAMYTLPHHFEFLSDAWIEEARAWFAGRRERLAAPFSISERMTDPPPHMGLPDDVAAWTVR